MENVPAILSRRNMGAFTEWIDFLSGLGYTSSHAVLNAVDFDVPQSRRRCFMVSALGGYRFRFPEGHPTDRRLRDVLEEDADESYRLSDERTARYESRPSAPRGDARVDVVGDLNDPTRFESANRVYGVDGVSPTVVTGCGGGQMHKIVDGSFYMSDERIARYEEHKRRHDAKGHGLGWEPRVPGDIARPLTALPSRHSQNFLVTQGSMEEYREGREDSGHLRIRYLTPRECWRLMGQPDWAYDRAAAIGTSRTQLYKQAGNSIVVDVLAAIFKGMYEDGTWDRGTTLEDWCRPTGEGMR